MNPQTRLVISSIVIGLATTTVLASHGFAAEDKSGRIPSKFTPDTLLSADLQQVSSDLEQKLSLRIKDLPLICRAPTDVFLSFADGTAHRKSVCYYDGSRNVILVRGKTKLGESASMLVEDVSNHRKILLSHELAHAWQKEQVLDKVPTDFLVDRLVLHALLEGHAQWVAEQYAGEVDMKAPVDRSTKRQKDWSFDRESQFIYEDGLRYWKARLKANPQVTLKELLTDPKVTQRTIAYPDAEPTDLEPPPRALGQLLVDPLVAEISLTDFVSFRRLVLGWQRDSKALDLCRAYEVSWQAKAADEAAVLLRLATEEAAQQVYQELVEDRRKLAPVRMRPEKFDGIVSCGFSEPPTDKRPAQRILLIREGRFVTQIIDQRIDERAGEWDAWQASVMARYQLVRPSLKPKENNVN